MTIHSTVRDGQIGENPNAAATGNSGFAAAYYLASGICIVESAGDLLIPSATTAGQIYRVSERGCTCQAGMAGVQCWHASLVEIIQTTRERLVQVSYEEACTAMDELFA